MNLVGDTRYVSRADTAARASAARPRRARARSGGDGEIGAWLLGAKVCTVVDGTLFVHAGLHPKWARGGCDGINRRAAQELARAVPRAGGEPQPAFAPMLSAADGPVWWRGLAERVSRGGALLDESPSSTSQGGADGGRQARSRSAAREAAPERGRLDRATRHVAGLRRQLGGEERAIRWFCRLRVPMAIA